ncbi:hypothetical protein K8353_35970, partial [Burkholderia contaminans]|nr:hypothetical protein [Burkholderia contaminans]
GPAVSVSFLPSSAGTTLIESTSATSPPHAYDFRPSHSFWATGQRGHRRQTVSGLPRIVSAARGGLIGRLFGAELINSILLWLLMKFCR